MMGSLNSESVTKDPGARVTPPEIKEGLALGQGWYSFFLPLAGKLKNTEEASEKGPWCSAECRSKVRPFVPENSRGV